MREGLEEDASVSPIRLVLGWAGMGPWTGAHGVETQKGIYNK